MSLPQPSTPAPALTVYDPERPTPAADPLQDLLARALPALQAGGSPVVLILNVQLQTPPPVRQEQPAAPAVAPAPVPAVRPSPSPPLPSTIPEPERRTELKEFIVKTIREAGKRLTGRKIKEAVKKANFKYGESTVDGVLTELVRRDLRLTNGADRHGKGYGLSEWQM